MLTHSKEVGIPLNDVTLEGSLNIPEGAQAIVLFAHGSGSSRHSSRNKFVATKLEDAGFATLLFDLLTVQEDADYSNRFNISLITDRLLLVTDWLKTQPLLRELGIGYFGASTGAAAALDAAAAVGDSVKAVVSRGGRPDLATRLPEVNAPTLLLVGSLDTEVIGMNQQAASMLNCEKDLIIIEGATHLFEEPGKLEEVAGHASSWFSKYLKNVYV